MWDQSHPHHRPEKSEVQSVWDGEDRMKARKAAKRCPHVIPLCYSQQGATGGQSDHIISLLNLAERLPLPSWEKAKLLSRRASWHSPRRLFSSRLSLLLTFPSSPALLDSPKCARLSPTTGLSTCCSSCPNTFPPPLASLS